MRNNQKENEMKNNWQKVKLSSIAEILSGDGAPKGTNIDASNNGLPFIRAGNLEQLIEGYSLNKLDRVAKNYSRYDRMKRIPAKTILFAKSGMSATKDRVYLTNSDAFFVNHLAAVLPSDDIDAGYMKYFFQFYGPSKLIVDQAYPSIRLSDIRNLQIPLPPLPIQKKIAEALDTADEIRRKRQQTIEKLDELVQSVFLDMFGDPVTNDKNWDEKSLIEVSLKITDGTHHSPPLTKSGYKYVTAKHIKPRGIFFESDPTYISKESHNEIYARCDPEFGDVLYIKDGATTGIAAKNTLKEPISLLSSVALLKPKTEVITSDYLVNWLNHPNVKARLIDTNMSGAAIRRYTLSKIKTFPILVPPLELQQQFAYIVKKVKDIEKYELKNSQKSSDIYHSLMQKAFNGELEFA